jgi:aminobenzoyl-glutamate utilization protein B
VENEEMKKKDLPSVVDSGPCGASVDRRTSAKDTAFRSIERNGEEIAKVGDSIFYFAELGMQEIETSRLLVGVLRDIGYRVEAGISGFPTGFLASYGSGKPVIAVHVEYDALPSGSQTPGVVERRELVAGAPGHAEGHNTNPAVMVGAAFGIKEAMDRHRLTGTVKLFGSPAEEQLVSRSFFVRDGHFEGVDAALHVHVGNELSVVYGIRSSALISVEYEFFGKTAHAGNSPWTGISAADAAKLMDIGWDVLREHLPPTQRSHSVIKDGGVQPNVVPDYAKIWWYFREASAKGAADLFRRARKMARGACLMTGATHRETVVAACWPNWDNKVLAEIVQTNIELVGMPRWSKEEQALARRVQKAAGLRETGLETEVKPLMQAKQAGGSCDSGDITYVVPHARIVFPANIAGTEAHHWSAGIAPATSIAHKGEVTGAKVLAGSMIDLMVEPGHLAGAKAWFDRGLAEAGIKYAPLLPSKTKPPVKLNREEMGKYRDRLKKYYLNVPIRFRGR